MSELLWSGWSGPCNLGIKQFKRQAGGTRAGVDAYKKRQWARVRELNALAKAKAEKDLAKKK